ncbi:hypothetical protein [Cohnella sp.]|uniref:hypothetical protein n=1 Tax=Cohnella sp. TaxID=1883426 RepID=UPI003568A89B
MLQKEHDVVELLKAMPKKELSAEASRTILNSLRERVVKAGRTHNRYHLLGNVLLFMTVIVFIGALPFTPLIVEKAKQGDWFQGVFPITSRSQTWEISPKFDHVSKDGTVIYSQQLRGVKGKIAFTEHTDIIANSKETVAKIFWYAWGESDRLIQSTLTATAVNLQSGSSFLLNTVTLQGAFHGADAHAVTTFHPFPQKGIWRIDIDINDKRYGSIVVPVKDEYIQTDTTRFLLSKDDAVTGQIGTVLVVPGTRDDETIEVSVSPVGSADLQHNITFRKSGSFNEAGNMTPITHYWGVLQFDTQGLWQIKVLGQKTTVTVKQK